MLLRSYLKKNPFDFTDYAKVENDADLGLYFEVAEKNKILYNQGPVNTLIN